jgi:hypothetical protein
MKKLLLLLLLPACSSVSKETYTEKRTLKYPKGGTPHIKDFYLHKQEEPTPQYAGIHYSDQSELDRLHRENALLLARQYNATLNQ